MNRLLLIAILIGIAATSHGHSRSESWSQWQSDASSIRGKITIAAREVTRLPLASADPAIISAEFARYAADRVIVNDADGRCLTSQARPLAAAAGFVRVEVVSVCKGRPTTIHYRVFFDLVPSHIHFARFGADLQHEQVITAGSPEIELGESDAGPQRTSFATYFGLGLRHLGSGYDHLAFLLALLLIARTWRRAALAVTGFTLGHSLTLALSVSGVVVAHTLRVEAFIGFTIALVAAEYIAHRSGYVTHIAAAAAGLVLVVGLVAIGKSTPEPGTVISFAGLLLFSICFLVLSTRLRSSDTSASLLLLVACAFGMIHGFGFARFLTDVGFAGGSIARPLLGFNLGVEAGQLTFVAACLVAASVVRRAVSARKLAVSSAALAAALCGTGVFWFVSRSLG